MTAPLDGTRGKGGPKRSFDYDEARALRTQGDTISAIALKFGVSKSAVRYALGINGEDKRDRRQSPEWYADYHIRRGRELGRKRRRTRRLRVVEAYGGKCACCGENEEIFLAVDHIFGGGNQDRKYFKKTDAFYLWLIENDFPPEYRLLCHNCNHAESRSGCPHRAVLHAVLYEAVISGWKPALDS